MITLSGFQCNINCCTKFVLLWKSNLIYRIECCPRKGRDHFMTKGSSGFSKIPNKGLSVHSSTSNRRKDQVNWKMINCIPIVFFSIKAKETIWETSHCNVRYKEFHQFGNLALNLSSINCNVRKRVSPIWQSST